MDLHSSFEGKRVLITGVAGTVGYALANRLSKLGVSATAGLDNNETGLFMVGQRLGPGFESVLGDVRDRDKLTSAFRNMDIVFHAAALKHVPLCEHHPLEAIQTNILGVKNVSDAVELNMSALENSLNAVLIVSTDKACAPANVRKRA